MARIVCVHGVGQQYGGEESALRRSWASALRDGIRLTGPAGRSAADELDDEDIRFAFYGNIFRPAGRVLSVGPPPVRPADLTDYEAAMLMAWWRAAAETDPAVMPPDARTLARTPAGVQ